MKTIMLRNFHSLISSRRSYQKSGTKIRNAKCKMRSEKGERRKAKGERRKAKGERREGKGERGKGKGLRLLETEQMVISFSKLFKSTHLLLQVV